MARKLYYRIPDDGVNRITDDEWEEIQRLQHWYNSEFVWTGGRLALKMFAIFPNAENRPAKDRELREQIKMRFTALRAAGKSENAAILQLEKEGLIITKRGGYLDNCIASGFTRVAGNEYNAYLVCEFLLKVSIITKQAIVTVYDEGEFVKPKTARMQRGTVIIPLEEQAKRSYYELMIANRHVFAVVDSAKYDHFPKYRTTITDFNDLTEDERQGILHDWNWLGFESNFDINGDDIRGFDLNKKVSDFRIEIMTKSA